MGDPWLAAALGRQSAWALGSTLAFCAAALAGVQFGAGAQLAVLLAAVIVTGMPHGAFDHWVARPILARRLGRHWAIPFGAAYLGLSGLVWFAWQATPGATLVAFLLASGVHFGLGDTEDGLAPTRVPKIVAVSVYGTLPLLLPVALHSDAAAPVLAALAGLPVSAMVPVLRSTPWLLPLWAAGFVWVVVAAWRERRGVAERLATALGFALLPPLLAFGLYFGTGHAVRHMLRLGAWHSPCDPRAATRWLAMTAVPAGALCAAGVAALALAGRDTTVALLTPGFRLIAALTLPHMLVTASLERARAPP